MNPIDGAGTTPSQSQAKLRRSLGIPDSATYVLVLDQSAHCDWDWRWKFRDYLEFVAQSTDSAVGVAQILDAAIDNLTNPSDPGYRYSFCELGYLQAYLQLPGKSGQLARLAAAGDRFRIVGGGITSPDCLLSAGEAFIRNYLVGKLWLAQHLPGQLPLRQCWIPDDFGQDPELPVSLAAMGMTGVSFSRLPGLAPSDCYQNPAYYENDFIEQGADFTWQASDGVSTVFTHWMLGAVPGYYTPGDALRTAEKGGDGPTPEAVLTEFLAANNHTAASQPPYSAAPSNYVYLPIDADFMHPLLHLSAEIADFNAGPGAKLGVYAVAASFADFVELALATGTTLRVRRYNGTPVYTGMYASRPALKTLHYQGTRSMLAAEALGLLAYGHDADTDAARAHWAGAAAAWRQLVPSTHHDYIPGTASDATDNKQPQAQNVVYEEQLPLLTQAVGHATSLADTALAALAAHADADEWVVVNPSGVPYSGPIELTGQLPEKVRSVRIGDGLHRVQRTETRAVFTADLPSLARRTASPSSAPSDQPIVGISPVSSGASSYTLSNEHLRLVVSASADWGIVSLADARGREVIGSGRRGNDLQLWADDGNIYQFGNEISGYTFENRTQVAAHGAATVVEAGPVRVVLTVTTWLTLLGAETKKFIRTYELIAGEPFVRMTTTGAAPAACSVMTAFGLADPVDSIWHGTPNHWTTAQPVGTDKVARPGLKPLWGPPVFRATHEWLLARSGSATLAAVYHPGVPAWSFDGDGNLLGCLLRNTPGNQRAAMSTDSDVDTAQYALRVPAGLTDPTTGQVFREARNYAMPAVAAAGSSSLPAARNTPQFLARVDDPGLIPAVKPSDTHPGTFVLRLYQPTNGRYRLNVTLGHGRPESVQVVTALEDPIPEAAERIDLTGTGFTIDMPAALATVQVTPSHRRT